MASTLQETIISPSDRSFFLVRFSSDAQTFTLHEVIHPSFAELFFITGIKSNRAIFDADLEHSTKDRWNPPDDNEIFTFMLQLKPVKRGSWSYLENHDFQGK